jgi:glutaredoxin
LPLNVNAQTVGDKPLLYVREGCSHCAKVKAFLDKYNLNDKVKILETFNNEANTKELDSWFVKLNVTDPNEKGVPFLVVDDKTYLVGDVPIIEKLSKDNNITIDVTEYQSSTSDTIFLVIGGFVLFGVLGYGIVSSFKKKN